MSDKIKLKMKKGITNKPTKKLNAGFTAALMICIVAIAAATYSTYKSIDDYVNPQVETDTAEKTQTQSTDESDVNIGANHNMTGIIDTRPNNTTLPTKLNELLSDTDLSVQTDTTKVQPNDTSENLQASDSEDFFSLSKPTDTDYQSEIVSDRYLFPAGQTVIKEYSADTPVYSKTMQDWRVHLGTDFLAEKGTKVTPITTGTVKDIYIDGLYGVTVVIDHGNDVIAYYCGLGSTTLVNIGDKVGVGDYIGSVNTVPCESLDEPHLHLEIKVDDAYVDPMELLTAEN